MLLTCEPLVTLPITREHTRAGRPVHVCLREEVLQQFYAALNLRSALIDTFMNYA